ncbi:MAG: hypothetical protein K0R26_291 [Bacteroidota bacterium]|jgi:hypothetical protein|nr:hypothetical protein [Bacteroidota bacterium]
MRYYTLSLLFLLISFGSFGQFKNTYAANGNPTSQIIDASGMKQGAWLYFEASDVLFRKEIYSDNVLVKNVYVFEGMERDLNGYTFQDLPTTNQKVKDFILKNLASHGNGELIVFDDGTAHVHFYLNKLKSKPQPVSDLNAINQLGLKKTIIKF